MTRQFALALAPALRAEWTKLRTVSGPGSLLVAATMLTVAASLAAIAANRCPPASSCQVDTVKLSLTGLQFGQALVAILAVLIISNEYGTGLMLVTLTAVPRRVAVLTAKASLLVGLVLISGTAAVLGSLLAGRLILPGHGFTQARGFTALSLANGPTLRAAAGSVLYLALIALLSLGIATLVRESAVAIGVVLGVLYLVPIVTAFIQNAVWQQRIERYSPTSAGLAIQATTGLRQLPIGPWEGLGVLALWALVALSAGAALFRLRDA